MEEDFHKNGLYRWQRQSKPKVQSRSHRVKSSNDIQDWIKLALEDDFEVDEAAIYERVKRNALGDTDPYANLYEMEVPDAVDSVLKNMLSKEVVKDTFKKKIGLDEDPLPDPRTKMELRHQMVKENRERRQREEDKRRQQLTMRKEARLTAQKLIVKEQKERESRARHEDQQLKKEMARIRKEMHEDRYKKEEEMKRKREEKEALDKLARQELERQTAVEQREMIESHKAENDRRKKLLLKRQMLSAKIASRNLQCLHRHFTAWYDLVLTRRLLQGKVKAMADWKLMLRVWGAWRSHVRGRRLELETELHERNIIEAERHKLMAERHFSHSVLRRCMLAWQQFTAESVQRKELEAEQERTKNKMAALLSAVADGKLSGKSSTGSDGVDNSGRSTVPLARSTQSAKSRSKPDETSQQQQPRRQAWTATTAAATSNQSRPVTTDSNSNRNSSPTTNPSSPSKQKSSSNSGKGTPVPTEPWQITRQHLNLTKEQIANLGENWQDEDGGESESRPHSQVEIRRRFGTQPWMNRHYVPNSFEHRYTAQQVALKEQQAQIREQRRLIEELQYKQRQQTLRQRLLPESNTPPPLPPPLPDTEGRAQIFVCVVPPQGKEILRDECVGEWNADGDHTQSASALHSNGQNTRQRPGIGSQAGGVTQDVGNRENDRDDYSERCGMYSARSDMTSATSATNTTSATGTTQNSKYLKVLKNMEDRAAERARIKAEREERKRILEEEKAVNMEERAAERARIKAEREERKRILEEEKAAQILKEEDERQRQAEEEKKARIEAYRQKKRLEKQKEEEKYRQQARQQEMTQLADAHYTRAILKYRGLLPFKKLISLAKRNWLKAVRHHEKCLVRFNVSVLSFPHAKRTFSRQFTVKYKYHQHFLERRAQRHHAESLRGKAFHAWASWVEGEREESRRLEQEAAERYTSNLVKKCFVGWRDLPEKLKREEEKQKRKSDLRKRVAELIPDFKPVEPTTTTAASSVAESEDLS
ncbi:coiled-coil domain-containing 191 [Elysia marginata]|uniref:Coiled-coil domain-containing 191 n=1 Tax=Elysia marginata TaxID=1093978 RepID=A0AAV4GDV5_9GAST|nr:coiled-coil domain-containing 191 [Elysia marginata]